MLDEPTSALDSENEHKFMDILSSTLQGEENITVLIVTHRLHLSNYGNKILYLGPNNYYEYVNNFIIYCQLRVHRLTY